MISKERMAELREWAGEASVPYCEAGVNKQARADLLSVLDEVERLREKVELLLIQNERLKGPLSKIRIVGMAKASWKDRYFNAADVCQFLRSRAEKAEAELERARPLIEARLAKPPAPRKAPTQEWINDLRDGGYLDENGMPIKKAKMEGRKP